MRKKRTPSRWLAMALCLCMALGTVPLSGMAFAAELPCPNHQAHDESCGYIQEVAGTACKHACEACVSNRGGTAVRH